MRLEVVRLGVFLVSENDSRMKVDRVLANHSLAWCQRQFTFNEDTDVTSLKVDRIRTSRFTSCKNESTSRSTSFFLLAAGEPDSLLAAGD